MHAINWFEIPVHDLDRAAAFYETLFATPLQRSECGMALFPYQEGGVGGGLTRSDDFAPARGGVLPYLNAKDGLDTMLGRLQALGAEIALPKTEVSPEVGHIAIFIDSEGNRIGLHQEP
ncbi:VOC family protein [Chitinilyticum litopenaei]|uniref:VOC family protein n=1 Tax=Chitinilyticum litopenaei TaxID=1121276 RepID=UPI0003FAB6CF|nr:VOC family protein [Chitinilyticum litopenaei]